MSFYKMVSLNPFSSWVSAEMISEVRIDGYYYDYKFIELEKKLKLTEFEIVCLGDLFNVITDGDHEIRDYVREGIPFYTVRDIEEFQINDNNDLFISEADHVRLKRSKLEPNNLLITKTGRVGTTAVVPRMGKKGNISADVAILKSAKKAIDEHYLGTYLNSRYGQLAILRLNYGSTRPRITLKDIPKVQVLVPSIEIQKYIGDKVRRAEELREQAKWLKKEAEEIIVSELQLNDLQIQLKDIKNNFGWQSAKDLNMRIDSDYYRPKFIVKENFLKSCKEKFVTLGELIEVIFTGKKLEHHEEGKEVFYIQSGDISTSFLDLNTKVKVSDPKLRFLEQKDILFAKDGETIGKLAVNYSNEKMILNEHTYCIRLKTEYKVYSAYVYYLLCNELINDLIKREATGSAQKGLNQDFISKIAIPIIDENKIYKLNELEELRCKNIYLSKQLIQQAKQDVEDLIESNFDMSKLNDDSSTESRC